MKVDIKMEDIKCCLCKVDSAYKLYHKQGFDIVRCARCGLVYVNPRLRREERDKIYASESYYSGDGFGYRDYIGDYLCIKHLANRRLDLLEKFCKKGKLLDVGCAYGFFLLAARERGWEVYGVEISKVASDYARERYGLNVINKRLEDAHFPHNFFDVVTMWDVLEHFDDPAAVMTEVKRILRKDGFVFLQVPNFSSLQSKLMRGRWKDIKPHYHLWYFTLKTLSQLLNSKGFSVVKVQGGKSPVSLKRFLSKHGLGYRCITKVLKLFHLAGYFYLSCGSLSEVIEVLAKEIETMQSLGKDNGAGNLAIFKNTVFKLPNR